MEPKEIYEKIKSGKGSYEELLDWCNKNKEQMNLEDPYESRLYNALMKFSMKKRIGQLNKEEASIYTHFFAQKTIKDLYLDKKVSIEVLEEEAYCKRDKNNAKGICISHDDGTYTVAYNLSKIAEALTSDNQYKFLFGLKTIFHEIGHVLQNVIIAQDSEKVYKKEFYLIALEMIMRKMSSKFYKENYGYLLEENNANKFGLRMALEAIKEANPKLYAIYNNKNMKKLIRRYDKEFYKAEFKIKGKKGKAIKSLDTWSEIYINAHPEILKRYPILKVRYNEEGKKKAILQMLQEREKLIQNNPKKDIDELYEIILNQKFFYSKKGVSTEEELLELDKYIEQTGTDDQFIYDLIKFRLDRSDLKEEQKEDFIHEEKEKARKVRQKQEKQKMQLKRDELEENPENTNASEKTIKGISAQLRRKDEEELDQYMGREQ